MLPVRTNCWCIANAAPIKKLFIFTKRNIRRHGIDMRGKNQFWRAIRRSGIHIPARPIAAFVRLRNSHLLHGILLLGQELEEVCARQAFVVGGGFDIDELARQLNGVDCHVAQGYPTH